MNMTVTLKQVSEKIDYGFTTSATIDKVGPKFLRITDIDGSHIDWDSVPYCEATPNEYQKYALQNEDIVIARTGASTGRSQWVKAEVPAVFASYLVRIRVRPTFDSRFISYVLASKYWHDFVSSAAHGKSAQPNMSAGAMAEFEFACPPLPQQRAIAEVLGALDDKIAANSQLARTADKYLAALFARLTKNSSTIRLGEIATVNPESCKPQIGCALRYVDISSVRQGTYEFPEISSWDDAPSRARRQVRSGDTLWSTVRPNRRSHALNLSDDELLVGSTGLAVLRPQGVGFAYLYESTKTLEFSAYLENVAEGSAYPAVRANRFEDAPISWPSGDARSSFEVSADPLRKMQHSLELETRILATTRDTLLPQLMSGKLRVKDAEILVESVVRPTTI